MFFNNNYNDELFTPEYCFNEIDPYESLFSQINNINEQNNDYNFNYPNSNENEMKNDFILDNISKEEKIKIQENYIYENKSSYNVKFYPNDNQKNDFLGKKHNRNNDSKITFKKNRNYLNNYLFKTTNDKIEKNNNNISSMTSSNSHIKKIKPFNPRTDSFLIKFKSYLGKSFIKNIKEKLKKVTKRVIKFYAFNYTKFTLIATYNQNKEWLNAQMKDLLVLGGDANQEKNKKALKSLYKKKEKEFDEIKNLFEMSYKEIIERFYLSKYFDEFKKDEKNIKANSEFVKVMKISLLDQNGFITFLLTRKGNKEKSD